ncbi:MULTISPECIES: hypothetical protein [Pasteurellaceae]|uniref:Uncharacterized protein n=1 Tax=Pasteurella atlantica TaxID=2827233 RepID=A0AAW8CQG7_9PAST|nr:hypothetical protein [Pasteurella atlantica]MBR0573385.1 hypothetical protein [Pasteurella atlantica]MDP8039807.1 hypothetical protein [Pasteurella atlantica]MDP8041824.1 hypothetical protein [Pasteurella atlantica]MDP8043891.1 hypothetical protein [Pasteurella atlantica]MDP8046106.1 hypothetical protein [Pasteurella atlantica]
MSKTITLTKINNSEIAIDKGKTMGKFIKLKRVECVDDEVIDLNKRININTQHIYYFEYDEDLKATRIYVHNEYIFVKETDDEIIKLMEGCNDWGHKICIEEPSPKLVGSELAKKLAKDKYILAYVSDTSDDHARENKIIEAIMYEEPEDFNDKIFVSEDMCDYSHFAVPVKLTKNGTVEITEEDLENE